MDTTNNLLEFVYSQAHNLRMTRNSVKAGDFLFAGSAILGNLTSVLQQWPQTDPCSRVVLSSVKL